MSPKITTLASLYSVPGWVGGFLLLVLGFGDPTKGMTRVWDHFVILDVCECVILRPQIMLIPFSILRTLYLSYGQTVKLVTNQAEFGFFCSTVPQELPLCCTANLVLLSVYLVTKCPSELDFKMIQLWPPRYSSNWIDRTRETVCYLESATYKYQVVTFEYNST